MNSLVKIWHVMKTRTIIVEKSKHVAYRLVDLHRVKKQRPAVPAIPKLSAKQKKDIREFWLQYQINMPTHWHEFFYAFSGAPNVQYVSEDIFQHCIKPRFNDNKFAQVWSDKSYLDFFLQDTKTVVTVLRNVNGHFLDQNLKMISDDEAQQLIQQYNKLVVKPSLMTHTGKGVQLLKKPYDLAALTAQYKKNFIFQLPLEQHPFMARLNSSSVNCIRVNSVLLDNEVRVMSAFVKVGQNGAFADNEGANRYFIGLTSDGHFQQYAIDSRLKKYEAIPSGYSFQGAEFPFYKKLQKTIEHAHKCIPHLKFAFWDIAIDSTGEPVVVEVNLRHPVVYIAQAACGPFFGSCTEQVMKQYMKQLRA